MTFRTLAAVVLLAWMGTLSADDSDRDRAIRLAGLAVVASSCFISAPNGGESSRLLELAYTSAIEFLELTAELSEEDLQAVSREIPMVWKAAPPGPSNDFRVGWLMSDVVTDTMRDWPTEQAARDIRKRAHYINKSCAVLR